MDNINALRELEQKKEAAPQWEQPIKFDSKTLPTFNTNVFATWLRKYIEAVANTTQTPVDASAIATISVLSTILSKKAYVKVSSEWKEPLNTYSIMALPPGNRKSGVFKLLASPITLHEKDERERLMPMVKKQQATMKAKRSRLDGLNNQYAKKGDESILKDIQLLSHEIESEELIVIPRFITNDVTVEKLGLLMAEHNEKMSVLSAEGAGALNSMAGRYDKGSVDASMNLYLEAHPGDTVTIDRMGRESIHLDEPSLTIGLFIQPETVRNLPPSFNERGLMQRFLYAFPESMVGFRNSTPSPINEAVRAAYLNNMKQLMEHDPEKPIMLTFSNEAAISEIQNREEIEIMLQDDGELGGIREWGSKLAGQIVRITGLLHFADNMDQFPNIPTDISRSTFETAKSLRSYFIAHAKEAYGVMDSTDDEKDAKYILKRINEKFEGEPSVGHRDLFQLVRKRFKKVENMDMVLTQLENMNYIAIGFEGRKRVIYLNPLFTDTANKGLKGLNSPQTQMGQGVKESTPKNTTGHSGLNGDAVKTSESLVKEVSPSVFSKGHTTNTTESKGEGKVREVSPQNAVNEITIQDDGSGLL
ncbi:YfjI family protein [Planococcus faecalis]|uniref:DUF3987 domain-containing protein n=1 Tax=Planococcus faecalis TaxID=1598147 RepID=A0ABN4XMG8_9BACL|nr:YfjI family protein [Planococcus faecalis]AQU78309.1 hypothetical protein AJGP001_02900 [Planococcus faecalis]OHX51305.1 hypothetical protein BB777_17340 [Planococcus faecalis]